MLSLVHGAVWVLYGAGLSKPNTTVAVLFTAHSSIAIEIRFRFHRPTYYILSAQPTTTQRLKGNLRLTTL
jgi:hypothetical protein